MLRGMKVVLATGNPGKVRELKEGLAPLGWTLLTLADFALRMPKEEGATFLENALLKAAYVAKATGLPALADDSGLEIDALGGAPGVYTADWAEKQVFEGGPGRDWYMAMGKVEGKLSEIGPNTDRSAYFICTLALAWPDGHHEIFEGRVQGSLTWPPRGLLGFGYDPVFVPEGRSETFAELDPQEKHAMSHRADAFRKLVAAIFS